MSLQNVADKLGVTKQTVHKWEKKQRPIPMERLDQLAEVLSVSKEYLLKEELTEEDKLFIKKEKLKAEIEEIETYYGGEVKVVDGNLYSYINIENWDVVNGKADVIEINGEWTLVKTREQINYLMDMKIRVVNRIVDSNWFRDKIELRQYLDELIILEDYLIKHFLTDKEKEQLEDPLEKFEHLLWNLQYKTNGISFEEE